MSLIETFKGIAVREPITISARQLEEERQKPGTQCCAMFRGATSSAFCLRRDKHGGPHRGDRVQWTIRSPEEELAKDLTSVQTALLLDAEECSMPGDGLRIKGPGAHRIAQNLAAKGLVRVVRSADEKARVHVTEKGRRLARRVRASIKALAPVVEAVT